MDKKILTCAAEAQISTTQWIQIFEAVGAERIEDIFELSQADFDCCDFKPLLRKRVTEFHGFLHDRYADTDELLLSWHVLDGSSFDSSSPDGTSSTTEEGGFEEELRSGLVTEHHSAGSIVGWIVAETSATDGSYIMMPNWVGEINPPDAPYVARGVSLQPHPGYTGPMPWYLDCDTGSTPP